MAYKGIGRVAAMTAKRVTVIASASLSLLVASSAQAAPPTVEGVAVSKVTADSVVLIAEIDPGNAVTSYRFEYGPEDCSISTCATVPDPEGSIPAGSSAVPISFPLNGLSPGTTYHLRVVAKNVDDESESPDRLFATYAVSFSGLPDGRAYEQASPIEKNAADARGAVPWAKVSTDGGRVAFLSTSGIPGGVGEQELPAYLASRDASGWSTQGLLPPASLGTEAVIRGWLPNFSQVFEFATDFGGETDSTFVARSSIDGSLEDIIGHGEGLENAINSLSYVGASADGAEVVFEADAKLACCREATEEGSNVYLWDRASDQIHLVSVMNDKAPPTNGAFAGPYNWMTTANLPLTATEGGAARSVYAQDTHVVSAGGGTIYFTATGSGALFERINPTEQQSPLNEGRCIDPSLACTLEVSTSHRTPPDPVGSRPAAFMAATEDGSSVFFASPEELTDDSNTGPVQPPPAIQRAATTGPPVDKNFPIAASGIAVDSEHIYWANTQANSIGRADLDGESVNPVFISVPDIEVDDGAGGAEKVPAEPQYVAVDAGKVYWTNAPKGHKREGTIGRADIAGTNIQGDWIRGAHNPQGIAVNDEFVYWANAGGGSTGEGTIGRAKLNGEEPIQEFIPGEFTFFPQGLALDAEHIYWSVDDPSGGGGYLGRADLDGSNRILVFIDQGVEPRGVAVDAGHVYWASHGSEAIGRANLDLGGKENIFTPLAGRPKGLALDASQTHLFWSLNGESVPNPGNDLYRYRVEGEALEDLTPDATDVNGAEVKGVLGASADGKRIYFAANGDLDGGGLASTGNCKGVFIAGLAFSGQCSLYLAEETTPNTWNTSFIVRLDASGDEARSDALNWVGRGGAVGRYEKSALLSADGSSLLFRSQRQLTPYDNEGHPELYHFQIGDNEIHCVSCNPTGEAPVGAPRLGSIGLSALPPQLDPAYVLSRNLSADGKRVFFESSDPLVIDDTNGEDGCEDEGAALGRFPSCQDVYEWEAKGTGSCGEDMQGGGCLYLLSTGISPNASFFADASLSGDDVFIATRSPGLVGQDQDQLQDIFDLRVGGGLPGQNPKPKVPCEGLDACHGPQDPQPASESPVSEASGPGNKKHVRKKHRKKHKKHHKRASKKTGGKSR